MSETDRYRARAAAQIRFLERLIEYAPDPLGTEEGARALALRSSKGMGPALKGMENMLHPIGLRSVDVAQRTPQGWRPGPRVARALAYLRPLARTEEEWAALRARRARATPERCGRIAVRSLFHQRLRVALEHTPVFTGYLETAEPLGQARLAALLEDQEQIEALLREHEATRADAHEPFVAALSAAHGSTLAVPEAYREHGEMVRGRDDYDDANDTWSESRHGLAVETLLALAHYREREEPRWGSLDEHLHQHAHASAERSEGWARCAERPPIAYVRWVLAQDGIARPPPPRLRLRARYRATIERHDVRDTIEFESLRTLERESALEAYAAVHGSATHARIVGAVQACPVQDLRPGRSGRSGRVIEAEIERRKRLERARHDPEVRLQWTLRGEPARTYARERRLGSSALDALAHALTLHEDQYAEGDYTHLEESNPLAKR